MMIWSLFYHKNSASKKAKNVETEGSMSNLSWARTGLVRLANDDPNLPPSVKKSVRKTCGQLFIIHKLFINNVIIDDDTIIYHHYYPFVSVLLNSLVHAGSPRSCKKMRISRFLLVIPDLVRVPPLRNGVCPLPPACTVPTRCALCFRSHYFHLK